MPENSTEVTAAGIARLAGVGRAAVSNWRRRHADFPKPVGGTETSPSFALPEVEQWLRDQGKLAEIPLRERVWQQLAGHPAGAVPALVHAGCALLLVRDRPTAWLEITAVSDERMATVLHLALTDLLAARFGPVAESGDGSGGGPSGCVRAVHTPTADELLPSVPLLRATAELAAGIGARQAFEFLLGRQLDANPRQFTLTPPDLAELMAALVETGSRSARTVLDPATGTGALLRALSRPTALYGQDADPDLAALTALRLALNSTVESCTVAVRTGDTLRADAFPRLAVDAVLCHPPFNERNWGHDELAYDPRWEYGFPARTESELAWVQHALAHLREGGTAVLLMPPAAASRRSGRRIRADLLRRGALRAVVALPAGAAPPYGIPLHLWVLRKPGAGVRPSPELLLVDTAEPAEPAAATAAATASGGRDRLDWQAVRSAVLDAWEPFDRAERTGPESDASLGRTGPDRPGVSRVVPVIELLDDDVDLAPARHLPPPTAAGGSAELTRVRDRLTETLRLTATLTPPLADLSDPARWPLTTVGELARAGALQLRTGGSGTGPGPVLTEYDVLGSTAPSGTLPATTDGPPEEPVLVEPGDVVVPVLGGGTVARVIDEATAGAALGRNLQLLRPDPAALDPWFLAGFLRGTANNRQASSYASTATRLDARRLQLPRLPLAEQQRYGAQFRALAAFEDALRLTGRLGGQLVQGMYDGLTDGTVTPK
ncbi:MULTISPECIES: N-6 DNA methylase [unclassified Streptomyces]|nr:MULTISPECIES: N-6 DNA methylase [unclassified Streptomyces]MDX2728634.1 N-6 DNA methylase [Streptomyces sp. PA03-2a]MDX3766230.1 N-6 DNA methylase [Streptomyces sp. AK08-01B]MDX3816514.1 N-6 DNA methylase [Streptomyces sp. AK08-01A]SCZ04609.1 N-6 DNA Methylase [Streptomyces sp. 136MFCol5.1]SFT15230.1 N-6 DNA Methylase [Streptomyces sp. ok210]